MLISDCSLSYLFSRREVIRALSSLVVPSEAVYLTDKPTVEAPELEPLGCSPGELEESVKRLLELSEELAGTEIRFPGASRQILSRFLSPTRLVMGDTRRFEEGVGARIASSLIGDVVARLAEFLDSGVSEVVKVLYMIDPRKKLVFAVIGNRLVRNSVVSLELSRDREALSKLSQLARS